MKLDNFLALTNTTLLNTPSIVSFENICSDSAKVKRGDLFFAYEKDSVKEALLNGAYAVIFEDELEVSDHEVAWIYSKNLDETLGKITRFRAIEKNMTIFECDEIVFKLAMQIQTDGKLILLDGGAWNLYGSIVDADFGSFALVSHRYASDFASTKKIERGAQSQIDIIEKTLFETSFIYENIFYERQLLSPFFMPYLEELFWLYRTLDIDFTLKKFAHIDHFEPVFVNKKFEVKNFGTSERVLIFEPNESLIGDQMPFLTRLAPWANILFILPEHLECEDGNGVLRYANEDEIVALLSGQEFHFALIVGVAKSILEKPSEPKNRQLCFEF